MKSIIVGRLLIDDSTLVASRNLNVANVKDAISAALTFTPFSTSNVDLVYARVAEKYYLACKKQGYTFGFFRNYTLMALCRLDQDNKSEFDGVYIPFTGELYILPKDVFEFAEVGCESCDILLREEGDTKFFRRFKLEVAKEVKPAVIKKPFKKMHSFFAGFSPDGARTLNVKRIESLIADADVKKDGACKEEAYAPMTFLYD